MDTKKFSKALEHYNNGDYMKSYFILQKLQPDLKGEDLGLVYYYMGCCCICSKKYQSALTYFTRSNSYPINPEGISHFGLAVTHDKLGNTDNAASQCRKAVYWYQKNNGKGTWDIFDTDIELLAKKYQITLYPEKQAKNQQSTNFNPEHSVDSILQTFNEETLTNQKNTNIPPISSTEPTNTTHINRLNEIPELLRDDLELLKTVWSTRYQEQVFDNLIQSLLDKSDAIIKHTASPEEVPQSIDEFLSTRTEAGLMFEKVFQHDTKMLEPFYALNANLIHQMAQALYREYRILELSLKLSTASLTLFISYPHLIRIAESDIDTVEEEIIAKELLRRNMEISSPRLSLLAQQLRNQQLIMKENGTICKRINLTLFSYREEYQITQTGFIFSNIVSNQPNY